MKKTLAVLLLASTPLTGHALDWAGRLGFSWTRQDDWRPVAHDSAPFLDLDVGLKLRGAVRDPRVAWFRAGADFRLLDRVVNGTRVQRNDTYTYSLAAALFDHQASPFSLSASANRITGQSSGAEGKWLGSRTGDFGSAGARLALRGLPRVSAGYSWDVATDELPTQPDHERTLQRIDAGIEHGSPAFHLSGAYRGEWSGGNWQGEDYQLNSVRLDANALIGNQTNFTLSDQYYQRSPTASFDAALAAEQHYFSAGIRHSPGERRDQAGQYVYRRAYQAVGPSGSAAASSQALEYWREIPFTDGEYSARVSANAAMTEQSVAGVPTRATGETIGLQGQWARRVERSYTGVSVGPSVGLLQTDPGGNDLGYGLSGSFVITRPLRGVLATGRYNGSYGNNLNGTPGWGLRHALVASGQGPLGSGNFNAQLQIDSSRGWSPTFGDTASRSVLLNGAYYFDRTQLRASLTVGSGIAGNPGDKFIGDGLLLPAPFNSHSIFAGLSASTATTVGLTALAGVRYGDTNVPGQPAIIQYGGDASLAYSVGVFSVGVEDHLTTYGYASGRVTTNLVLLRLSRAMGDAF